MTSSEMPTRIAMPMPFASGASATRATIESVSGDNLNYVDGFPGKYSLPASEGGKYVSRGEMNAIGNMASNDLHYFKCGGLNTFDAAFCEAVGGYPKGAVLDYIVGYKLYKVISLVDGNMIDFTTKGVDDVNWHLLNQDEPSEEENDSVEAMPVHQYFAPVNVDDGSGGSSMFFIGSFTAAKTGYLSFSLTDRTTSSGVSYKYPSDGGSFDTHMYYGVGLLVKDKDDKATYTREQLYGYKIVPGTDPFLIQSISIGLWSGNTKFGEMISKTIVQTTESKVTKGSRYNVVLLAGAQKVDMTTSPARPGEDTVINGATLDITPYTININGTIMITP